MTSVFLDVGLRRRRRYWPVTNRPKWAEGCIEVNLNSFVGRRRYIVFSRVTDRVKSELYGYFGDRIVGIYHLSPYTSHMDYNVLLVRVADDVSDDFSDRLNVVAKLFLRDAHKKKRSR